jgi:5'-nucleotidase
MVNNSQDFVLGVDLDGVCADYEAGFRKAVARILNVDPATIPPQTAWEFTDSNWPIRDREQYLELHKQAVVEFGLFRKMDSIPGASEGLWKLSKKLSNAGVWIRIISHRLFINFAHGISASDTVNWLEDHQIPYRDLCLIADKPAVGCNLYLDDSPTQVTALQHAGADVLIFDRLYNQGIPGDRATDWDEVVEKVQARQEHYRSLPPQHRSQV